MHDIMRIVISLPESVKGEWANNFQQVGSDSADKPDELWELCQVGSQEGGQGVTVVGAVGFRLAEGVHQYQASLS